MQGCVLVDSHKSAGSGPVRSPVSCPIKKQNTNQKQKQPSKQNTHNHNQTKPNKQKTQRSGIATSYENNMHDDILCVIMSMATEKEAKPR